MLMADDTPGQPGAAGRARALAMTTFAVCARTEPITS